MSSDDLEFKISAKDAATGVLKSVRGEIAKVGQATKDIGSGLNSAYGTVTKFAGAFLAFQGVAGAINIAKASLDAFAEDEKAAARLDRVLESTGNTAKLSAKELKEFASARQNVTTFGDEVTVEAEAQLARFKNISGQTFKDTIVASQDMATVLGMELSEASKLLGKALSDPAEGLTKLKRAGVMLGKDKEDLIKYFQESGDAASAQAVILKELERQFKGAASAETDTFGGKLAQMKNTIGDLGEVIGAKLAPSVISLLEFLNEDILGGQNSAVTKAQLARDREITGTGNDRLDSYDKKITELMEARAALRKQASESLRYVDDWASPLLGQNRKNQVKGDDFFKQSLEVTKEIEAAQAAKESERGKIQAEQQKKDLGFKQSQEKKAQEEAAKKEAEAAKVREREKAQADKEIAAKELRRQEGLQSAWDQFQNDLSTVAEKNQHRLEDFDKLKDAVPADAFKEFRERLVASFSRDGQIDAQKELIKNREDKIKADIKSLEDPRLEKLAASGGRFQTRGAGNINDAVRKNEIETLRTLKSTLDVLKKAEKSLEEIRKQKTSVQVVNLN
jgi:hypothetical protein